ncbi:MAG TPA: YlxR family protein [Nocardioides sp.]|nr:YlxR family protein [Nocardioides sp.]
MAREQPPPAQAVSTPVRTCIGCRERATKRELLRVVAGTDAHGRPVVVPDPDGTAPGRGAHLHPTPECFDRAVRRRAFARALRLEQGPTATAVAEHIAAAAHRP